MMNKSIAKLLCFLTACTLAAAARAAVVATAAGTSFNSSVAVNSFTLNLPSNVNVGDLLVVQINFGNRSVTVSTPSGWTLLRMDTNSGSGADDRQYIFYRIATSSDTAGGSTSWSLSGGNVLVVAGMVGFRSDLGGRSIVIGNDTVDSGTNNSLVGGSMTAPSPGLLLRFFGYTRGSSTFTSSGLNELVSATSTVASGGATLLFASRTINSTGTISSDTVTASSSARWLVQSLFLTESTVTKPTTCFTDSFSSTSSFAQDWVTTSVGSTAFTPAITGGRLRLTSDNGYISTAATLQRLFPTSNLIYVEFNHYAYPRSNGADGIAVTLSDASITPQPGGFGGSLGYAQRSDSGGINGFAGGWIGIALDEYGNFSNPTEGRNGGPGFRVDSVAIRGSGSGQTGYAYVGGTTTLSPGIDVNNTSPAPGYRYRIVIDAAAPGQTYVTVDRDTTGTGSSYANLVPTFNIEAALGQATIPANLMLSLTGSTGGSSNVHEIGNLSVCATTINSTNQVDHFEFSYPTQGLTCEPQTVTVSACANAACSTLMSVPVTLTMNTSGSFTGGSTQTFIGSTTYQLRQTTAGNATFSVANSSPGTKPFGTNKCNATSANTCTLPFVDAGLEFDVPTLLANKPSGPVRLRAVKNSGDPSNSCVALFQNSTQAVSFFSTYTTPNSGTRTVELRAGSGSGAFTNISGTSSSPTALNLTFNGNGETTLEARYQDAGLMTLNARYNGSGTYTGLVLNGVDSFVSKPAGFCIDTSTSSTTCSGPNYANCSPFVAAGMPFRLQITAASWESDSDTNFCSGNGTTPNYTQSGVSLTPQIISPAPTGSNAGALASYSNALDLRPPPTGPGITITNGVATFSDITESEVGVFNFVVTPPLYFGQTINPSLSRNIGRFVPYRFEVTASANIRNGITPWGCGFTYQDQPFAFDFDNLTNTDYSPYITITALNAANQTTNNYDATDGSGNSFWKLGSGLAHSYLHFSPPAAGGTLTTSGTPLVTQTASTINNSDGKREYRITGETFNYTRVNTPTSANAPFYANLQMNIAAAAVIDADTYLDPNNLSNNDHACYRSGCPSGASSTAICSNACTSFNSSAITNRSGQSPVEIRYGRLRLTSASGPTDAALGVPATAEYWNGSQFVVSEPTLIPPRIADSCTTFNNNGAQLNNYQLNLGSGETSASINGTLAGGTSNSVITLSAPGANNFGSVDVTPNLALLPWLQFDWDNNPTTAFTAPTATASFGLYRGSDRVIYWQETQ